MFRRSPLAAALIAAFSAPLSSNVLAQHAGETALGEVRVSDQAARDDYAPAVSTVGGKVPTELRDIPQTVNVINRAVLDAQNANSLTEALRYVPGVTISAGEGGQIGDNINLRGFSARTDTFLDGFRDRGQYTRDTFFLESVEVLKGPSSMLFGRGSTGGVVNQVSKKAGLEEISEVGVTLGTDAYRRVTADLDRAISDTAAFRLAGVWHDADSTREEINSKRIGVAPSLRLGIGTPTEITLSALIQHSEEVPDYGFPFVRDEAVAGSVRRPVDAPAERYYGYTDDYFDQDVQVLTAAIQHKISPNLTLRNQLQFAKYRTEASPSPLGAVALTDDAPAGTVIDADTPLRYLQAVRQDRDRVIDDTALYNQTDLIAKFKTGSVAHTLVAGLELGVDSYDRDTYAWDTSDDDATVNLGNPRNGTRQGERSLAAQVDTDTETFAVYVNDAIELSPQWKLVGGLRWDRFRSEQTTVDYEDDETTVIPSHTDTFTSVRAGVIWQPTATQSYYISYGTSFNPSAESVTISNSNAGLEPEKNRSIEVGGKWDLLGGNLSTTASLFQIDKTNARTTDPVSGDVELDGRTRVRGLELGLLGRITPNWNVLAGYTYLDGELVESDQIGTGNDLGIAAEGNTLQNTPEHSASLWTTYLFAGNWEVGGGVVYSDDRYVNNFETAEIEGYTRYDATLAYRSRSFDVRLNLQNLSDEKYFETASGGRASPARGRTALATLTYRF